MSQLRLFYNDSGHWYCEFISLANMKVILVTGGSSGLGKSMCTKLSSLGYSVYGTSRNVEGVQAFENFKLIQMDVKDEVSVHRAIDLIHELEGKLDVLVNNAGISLAGPLEEVSEAEIKSVFETNVFGLWRTTKAALPLLRKSKGFVVNISSLAGVIALPFRGVYSASKFAVEALTESLSMEVSPFGVKVLLIQPGDLNTNINQNRAITKVDSSSVYYNSFQEQLKEINHQMNISMEPDLIGELIARILQDQKPKLRYRVGPMMQKASVSIKKILPGRLFEKILKNHLKLD